MDKALEFIYLSLYLMTSQALPSMDFNTGNPREQAHGVSEIEPISGVSGCTKGRTNVLNP